VLEVSVGKQTRAGGEGCKTAYSLRPPHFVLTDLKIKRDTSLVTQGWLGDKSCRVTVDTAEYVTVASPDIAAGWPEIETNPGFAQQTLSGESLPF
jgi:hypothetical protein